MKKIFILFFIILATTGCAKSVNDISNADADNVTFREGIYYDKEWNEMIEPSSYEGYVIPDKETALSVAEAIIKSFQRKGNFQNFVAETVFFDTEDELWIITFAEDMEKKKEYIILAIV